VRRGRVVLEPRRTRSLGVKRGLERFRDDGQQPRSAGFTRNSARVSIERLSSRSDAGDTAPGSGGPGERISSAERKVGKGGGRQGARPRRTPGDGPADRTIHG
jgi:hypothetical protein